MTEPARRVARWLDVMILLATIGLAILMVQWADREFRRTMRPAPVSRPHPVARLDWFWALEHPYRRVQHDWPWACVAATFGAVALLAVDGRPWTRRGRSRPGAIGVLVVLLLGAVIVADELLKAAAVSRPTGLSFALGNALEFRLPGAIIDVWVVTWLRPHRGAPDWREHAARLVGWSWMGSAALLIGYGLLFG